MKVFDYGKDGARERRILAGMITSTVVLSRVAAKWAENPFESRYASVVGQLCVDFYRKHSEAPGRGIGALFDAWSEQNRDEETIKLVEKFLSEASAEFGKQKDLNTGLVIDLAGEYFNKIRLKRLIREIEANLETGQVAKAVDKVNKYHKVEMGVGAGVDILNDRSALAQAFSDDAHEALITYPGDLGTFFGRILRRGGFISFLAPEKVGKSAWMLDIAWNALKQRRKVAYFQVGDLTEVELYERIAVRATRHPLFPGTIRIPRVLTKNGDMVVPVFEEQRFDEPLTEEVSWRAVQHFTHSMIRSKNCYFRLSVHPNYTIDVLGIRSILESWARDGWLPDVCIIDYADVLSPPGGYKEFRDQTNITWMRLRTLSQELRCLVVTATQSDADSYERRTMTRKNFSEDKRKLSHVTGLIGINVTPEEKENQVMRLNYVVLRDGSYDWRNCVSVAGCLAIMNPAIKSTF